MAVLKKQIQVLAYITNGSLNDSTHQLQNRIPLTIVFARLLCLPLFLHLLEMLISCEANPHRYKSGLTYTLVVSQDHQGQTPLYPCSIEDGCVTKTHLLVTSEASSFIPKDGWTCLLTNSVQERQTLQPDEARKLQEVENSCTTHWILVPVRP